MGFEMTYIFNIKDSAEFHAWSLFHKVCGDLILSECFWPGKVSITVRPIGLTEKEAEGETG